MAMMVQTVQFIISNYRFNMDERTIDYKLIAAELEKALNRKPTEQEIKNGATDFNIMTKVNETQTLNQFDTINKKLIELELRIKKLEEN